VGQGIGPLRRCLGCTLLPCRVRARRHLARFRGHRAKQADACFWYRSELFTNRQRIADFAIRSRLTLVSWGRDFASQGPFMSYGVNVADLFRRAAVYVDKVLKGAKPADLPVEQPTKFDLIINLRPQRPLSLHSPVGAAAGR